MRCAWVLWLFAGAVALAGCSDRASGTPAKGAAGKAAPPAPRPQGKPKTPAPRLAEPAAKTGGNHARASTRSAVARKKK